jgi:hypothetical protein
MRPFASAATLALALALSASSAPPARADGLPAGMKPIEVTYELTGIEAYPDYVFIVFPFLDCEIGVEHFKNDPSGDKAWTNYQVLRPGGRYPEPKFCSNGRIYALEAAKLTLEERVIEEDHYFYRKKGDTLVIIKEFDRLKTSEKRDLVRSNGPVRRSDFFIDFPMIVSRSTPFEATHDVLRVAEVTGSTLRIEPVKVIASTPGQPDREEPYVAGMRPFDLESDDFADRPDHPDSEEDAYEVEASERRRQQIAVLAVAGVLVVAAIGAIVRRIRKP